MRQVLSLLPVVLFALATAPPSISGQGPGVDSFRPHAEWRTLALEGLDVHYPAAAEEWVRPLAARMEEMVERVGVLVGRVPDRRVTVLVMDPLNVPDGYAIADVSHPLAVLWPTPPGPRAGEHLGWGELLFVHEYAHLAHLTFPSRNPRERLLWRLAPVRAGPVTRRAPRWVTEGYATYVEGRLTGSARPHGIVRPAFLRVRALEGRLPTYGELSGAEGFQDAISAYLAGSAFLEWLVELEGEESLEHLWRRLSARERRAFTEAFQGVYGAPPDELYGRFAVAVTEMALAARALLEEAGLEEGEPWELRRWHTGEPAVSPDGSLLAMVLHERDRPGRLVVRETGADEEELERRDEARARLLARDPLDVPAVERDPPPRKTVAALHATAGRSHQVPRFLPDGRHVLSVRWEPLPDGTVRPDLFLWDFDGGALRRVTRGAGIREADPSPDGRRAAGVRCEWGSCDLVLVELETGAVSVLAAGSPDRVFHGPRWAPDGASVVTSLRENGRWRLVSVALDREQVQGNGEEPRLATLGPDDDGNRYDPAFLPDGRLVAISDLGGIANLEILDPETGTVSPLTRVLGEVAAPAPDPASGYVYFLSRHSRGWDVRRVHPDSVALDRTVHLPPELRPAVRRPAEPAPEPFGARPVPEARPYGWGPQRLNLVPAGGFDAGGGAGHLAATMNDPVGRLGLVLQGAAGGRDVWTGGAAAAVVRRLPVHLRGEAFLARRELELRGGLLSAEGAREQSRSRVRIRAGASGGSIAPRGDDESAAVSRALGFVRGGATFRQDAGSIAFRQTLDLSGESGRTAGQGWARLGARGSVGVEGNEWAIVLRGRYGRLEGDAPLERFRIGGGPPRLTDPAVTGQIVEMPYLPPGLLEGDLFAAGRVELRLGDFAPFLWWGRTGPDPGVWHRVAGTEQGIELPALPQLGLPALTLAVGVGRSLDGPFEGKTRAYLSLGLRP